MAYDEGLRRVVKAVGNRSKLARHLGISPQAVQQWRQVPARHLLAVERATGVNREVMQPDLFVGFTRIRTDQMYSVWAVDESDRREFVAVFKERRMAAIFIGVLIGAKVYDDTTTYEIVDMEPEEGR